MGSEQCRAPRNISGAVGHHSRRTRALRGSFVKGHQADYHRLDGTSVEDTSDIRQADSLPVWHMREPTGVDDAYFFLNALGGRDWDWRLRAFEDNLNPKDVWYFLHDGQVNGAGYFVGYDQGDKRRIGFIGEKGFSVERPAREDWFPVERHLVLTPLMKLWTSIGVNKGPLGAELDSAEKSPIPPHLVFVPSGKELKVVDLSTRTVRTVLTTAEPIEGVRVAGHLTPLDTLGVGPTDQPAGASGKSARPNQSSDEVQRPGKKTADRSIDGAVAAMTAHKIYVLDQDLRQRTVFVIPEEARGEVELYLPQGWAVALMRHERTRDRELIRRQMLYKIAADGSFRDGRLVKFPLRDVTPWSTRSDAVVLPFALPSPAILWFVEPLVIARNELSDDYVGGFSVMFRESGVALLVLALFSISLAALTWRRGAAYSFSLGDQLAWFAFVALFGFGGYVGFLLHRRWPLREECPSCHAQTILVRGGCTQCGEGFPGPIFKGTEVFA